MNKYIISILITITSFFSVIAQNDEANDVGEKLPGYLITNKGEKIEGFFRKKGKIASQRKVKFYADKDTKDAQKFGAKDLKAYQIVNDYYESLPYEGLSGKTKVFIHRSMEGKINVFEYFQYVSEDVAEKTIAKKGDTEVSIDIDGKRLQTELIAVNEAGELLKFSSPKMVFGFKKTMSKYISDYPELSAKVKNKEKGYGLLNVLNTIEEYNSHFKK